MKLSYGSTRPANKLIKEAEGYGAEILKEGNQWVSKWSLEALKKFYIQGILFHEVGHHVDYYYRHFTRANSKQVEEFAEQYAIARTATATHVYNNLKGAGEEK